jgi:nucleoside 2-deoxyribosyltransferase
VSGSEQCRCTPQAPTYLKRRPHPQTEQAAASGGLATAPPEFIVTSAALQRTANLSFDFASGTATTIGMTQPYTIYFAGELFSLKHLLGNAVLAEHIHLESANRYRCTVPQDLEQRETTPTAIRDQDLLHVVSCDVGLFHFDGPELDSGTVVEFMVSKMLDIPSVIIRTDFRLGGDSQVEPWNLMCSGYPRTKVLLLDAMASYQEQLRNEGLPPAEAALAATRAFAKDVVQALDDVRAMKPRLSTELREQVYEWIRNMPGDSFAKTLSKDSLLQIVSSKTSRGLL